MEDTWSTVALPILRWVAEHESDNRVVMMIADLAAQVKANPLMVNSELERLIERSSPPYLAGRISRTIVADVGQHSISALALTERGARAVEMWPSGDAGDILLRTLEQALEAEGDPERKTKIGRILDALGGMSRDFVTELGVSIVKGAAGLP